MVRNIDMGKEINMAFCISSGKCDLTQLIKILKILKNLYIFYFIFKQQPGAFENNILSCIAAEIKSLCYTLEIQSILIRCRDTKILLSDLQIIFLMLHDIFSILNWLLFFIFRNIFIWFAKMLTLFIFFFLRKIFILFKSILTLFVFIFSRKILIPFTRNFFEAFLCLFDNIQWHFYV